MSGGVSPSTGRRYPLTMVCTVFRVARSTVYAAPAARPALARGKRGPQTATSDAALVGAIRAVLAATPLHGEVYRKVRARLAHRGLAVGGKRVLRLMRQHHLLAPRRPVATASPHQISLSDLFVCTQLLHGPLMADHALVDDVGAVTHLDGESDILLGEEDADAALLEPQDPLADRPHHERGQALGRLVEDQQARVREQRARYTEESLLASAQVLSPPGAKTLQHGERGIETLECPGVAIRSPPGLRDLEVLVHREVCEDPAVVRHEPDAQLGDRVRRLPDELHAVVGDAPGGGRRQAHDAPERRALSRAVPAQETHRLALTHIEGHAEEDVAGAVESVHVADVEDHSSSPR